MLAMNFTDIAFGSPSGTANSIQMNHIIQQFTEREPITGAIFGCTGKCFGTVKAAGLNSGCNTSLNSSFILPWDDDIEDVGDSDAMPVFRVVTSKDVTGELVNLRVFYVGIANTEIGGCEGVATTVECSIGHTVLGYPFTQRDGIIVPETRGDRVRALSTEEAPGWPDWSKEPVFEGLIHAAEALFGDSGTFQERGVAWLFNATGQTAATYLTGFDAAIGCSVAFRDPTEDILSKLNEIVFRIAVAMPNAASPRSEFDAQQETVAIVYESRYVYLWAALGITDLAVAAVARTASGVWQLGRPVTLSPLEIVNAFGPPLMREKRSGTSNMAIAELMEVYQDTQVQYASTDGGSGGAADTEAGDLSKRLQMCLPGYGRSPRPQELFTG